MSLQAVTAIKEAEARAVEIIKKAERDAANLVAELNDDALKRQMHERDLAYAEAEKRMAEAEASGNAKADELWRETEKQLNMVRTAAAANMQKAVEYIAKAITQ